MSRVVNFRLGELFCGPGGIALGATKAKFSKEDTTYKISHVWSTDYDKDTCETYRKNLCSDDVKSVICADIRNLDLRKLKAISEIDGLAFGFPCNDFSVVGEQQGITGIFGPLYHFGVKALHEFQPKWFLAENVGGLRNANDGQAFSKILREMNEAGYSIYPHLYRFDQYGVPQARQRIIIVGIRSDIDCVYRVPSPEKYSHIDNSARTALEKPPIPKHAYNHEYTQQSQKVVERLKHIKPGENAFNAKLPEDLKLTFVA